MAPLPIFNPGFARFVAGLFHAVRFRVVSSLMRREAYLAELVSELGISRKVVEYHVAELESRASL